MSKEFDPNEVIHLVTEVFRSQIQSRQLEIEVRLLGCRKSEHSSEVLCPAQALGVSSNEQVLDQRPSQVELPILNGDMRRL